MSLAGQIKEKIDAVGFISDFVKLKKAGMSYKGLCPFHKEKTPSFIVSSQRQIWHCFGCGKGGDVIKFVSEFENIEYGDALKTLADRAGIDVKKFGSGTGRDDFDVLYEMNEAATTFYQEQLKKHPSAAQYVKERGLKPHTIEELRVGFAPDAFDGVVTHLVKVGYRVQDAEKAGLIIKSDKGLYFDRFRGRIMFPIVNHSGRVCAFSGRILPSVEEGLAARGQEVAKYVNTPETPIFYKHKILYGFFKTKNDVRKENRVFLVEGQMDFLLAWQDGVSIVAATSGTALTEDHLKTLRQYSENLVLGFDNDTAGGYASERSIDMANALDFNVGIVSFGEHKDAAEFVMHRPGELCEKVGRAQSAMEFYFARYLRPHEDAVERKKHIRTLLGKIKLLGSPVEQATWIRALCEKSGIAEQFLIAELQSLRAHAVASRAPYGGAQEKTDTASKERLHVVAENLIALATIKKELLAKLDEHVRYLPEPYQKIYNFHKGGGDSQAAPDVGVALDYVTLKSGYLFNTEDPDYEAKLADEVGSLLHQLKLEWFKERRKVLASAIKEAESGGRSEELSRALEEFHRISGELASL